MRIVLRFAFDLRWEMSVYLFVTFTCKRAEGGGTWYEEEYKED